MKHTDEQTSQVAEKSNLGPAPGIDRILDEAPEGHDSPAVIEPTQAQAASDLLSTREDPRRASPAPESKVDQEVEQEPVVKTSLLTSSVAKVLAGVAILAITAVAMWPSAPVVSPIAQTGVGTGTALQTPTGVPSPTAPAGTTPPGVTVDIGTGGGEIELMGDISSAAARLAPVDQTCSTLKITAFDRATCSIEGPEKFFRCTQETGRRWNADLPGCELIPAGSTVAGKFHQGVIPGMDDVLLLNRTSLLALAGAPDSALVEALHRDVVADMVRIVGVSQGSAEKLDLATRTSLAPFLFTPEEEVASRAARSDERVPARLACRMVAGRQKNPDGSAAISVDSPVEIFLDRCAAPLQVQGDARPYIQMLRTSVAKIRSDIQKAGKFGLVLDLQAGKSFEDRSAGSRSLQGQSEYVARRLEGGEGVVLPFYAFTLPSTGQRNLVIKGGTNPDEEGTWRFCSQGDGGNVFMIGDTKDNVSREQAFRQEGDVWSTCVTLAGYTGPAIPTGMVIKDYDQLVKAKIDAHAVMLLSAPKLTNASDDKSGVTVAAVTMQPAGFQLIDARQTRVLSGVIPPVSGAIVTAATKR